MTEIKDLAVLNHNESMDIAEFASSAFQPRLQLVTSSSELGKSGKFPINHFAIIRGKDAQDIGSEVNVIVLAWRPKALDTTEAVSAYDRESDLFKRIEAQAGEKDSGCMFGPEFLLYVPAIDEFVTFFMGSSSGRNNAPQLASRMHNAATLKPQFIETKKYSWYTTTSTICSEVFELPEIDVIQKEVDSFMNPPESTVEEADETDATRE